MSSWQAPLPFILLWFPVLHPVDDSGLIPAPPPFPPSSSLFITLCIYHGPSHLHTPGPLAIRPRPQHFPLPLLPFPLLPHSSATFWRSPHSMHIANLASCMSRHINIFLQHIEQLKCNKKMYKKVCYCLPNKAKI